MTGNGLETVMGVMKNEAGTGLVYGNSGFNSSTLALDSKYVDVYTYGTTYNDQAAYNRRILGDATGETIKWDNSKAYYYFVIINGVWFCRGNMVIDSYSSSTTQYLSSIFPLIIAMGNHFLTLLSVLLSLINKYIYLNIYLNR